MRRVFAVGPALVLLFLAHACTGSDPQYMPVDPDPVDSGGSTPLTEAGTLPDAEAGTDAGCGNTQTSEDNCGACGHGCGGGKCAGGACQPVTIKDGLDNVLGVTTAGNAIFWYRARGASGALESCALAGCSGAPTVLTTELSEPFDASTGPTIASDGATVEFIAHAVDTTDPSNYVYGCAVTGCTDRSPVAASGQGNSIYQLARSGTPATSDSVLYYTTNGGSIRKCPFGTCTTAGTTPNVTRLVTTDQTKVGMAIDATHAYFYESGGNSPGIYSAPLTNGQTRTPLFAPTTGSTDHLTIAGTALVSLSGTTLFACDLVTPCANIPTKLAENQANVTAIAGDAKYVYYAVGTPGQTDGEIRACAMPSCKGGPRTLVKNLAYPTMVHARDGMVYWSERGTAAANTGAIKRISP